MGRITDLGYVRDALPRRKPDSHKGDYGKLLVLGGSRGYSGAPYMAAQAAARSGAGLVWIGVPSCIYTAVASKCTDTMPFPLPDDSGQSSWKGGTLTIEAMEPIKEKIKTAQVFVIGPGLGRTGDTSHIVRSCMKLCTGPVVLDADGINALAGHLDDLDSRQGWTILTPHEGEFSRLAGPGKPGCRLKAARDFAEHHGCVLVLKGHRTVVASPDGRFMINTTGNSGLSKGGSGDVLSGIIAAMLCQGAQPFEAAVMGVWIHGAAADYSASRLDEYSMGPMDVVDDLTSVFRTL